MLKVGYDIGGMSVRVCLFDDTKKCIAAQQQRPFPIGQGRAALIRVMIEMAEDISKPFQVALSAYRTVGIGIPGTVRSDTGVLVSACNLQVNGMPVTDMVRPYFPNADISIANDADTAALAELHMGAFRGYDSALLLTIGTGIGGGLIQNGKIFAGGLKVGCELGHITLQHNGLMCACGNRGCAETLCSATWLERQGRRCVIDYPMSQVAIRAGHRLEQVSAKDLLDAAEGGDGIAKQIFDEYIENLCSLVSTCSYLIGPRIIGLGGGVANMGSFLVDALNRRVLLRVRDSYRPEKIVLAELGNAAGMLGAAILSEYK